MGNLACCCNGGKQLEESGEYENNNAVSIGPPEFNIIKALSPQEQKLSVQSGRYAQLYSQPELSDGNSSVTQYRMQQRTDSLAPCLPSSVCDSSSSIEPPTFALLTAVRPDGSDESRSPSIIFKMPPIPTKRKRRYPPTQQNFDAERVLQLVQQVPSSPTPKKAKATSPMLTSPQIMPMATPYRTLVYDIESTIEPNELEDLCDTEGHIKKTSAWGQYLLHKRNMSNDF